MKIKYSILLFIICFLSIVKCNAITLEEAKNQYNENEYMLETLNYQIKSLNDEIEIYGKDFKEDNVYNMNISFANSNKIYTYNSLPNSFLPEKTSKTLGEILNEKEIEFTELTNENIYLEDVIFKLERLDTITFDPLDVTKVSNLTVEEVEYMLKGTALEPLAQDFIDAEKEYGVNAIFIMSICALESGWGRSARARNDNNLTGLGVYSDESEGLNSATKRDNIFLTTKILKNNYLTEGGSCYYGLSIEAVNTKYCVGNTWHEKVTKIGNRLFNDLVEYYEVN